MSSISSVDDVVDIVTAALPLWPLEEAKKESERFYNEYQEYYVKRKEDMEKRRAALQAGLKSRTDSPAKTASVRAE